MVRDSRKRHPSKPAAWPNLQGEEPVPTLEVTVLREGPPPPKVEEPPSPPPPVPPPPIAEPAAPRKRGKAVAVALALAAVGAGAACLFVPAIRYRLGFGRAARLGAAASEGAASASVPAPTARPDTRMEVAAVPRFGKLEIAATPAGATVWLDGQTKGVVQAGYDITVSNVLAGEHVVGVTKEGFQAAEERVAVERDKTASVRLRAQPLPRLTIQALWAAAKAGERSTLAGCFSSEALARMREIDQFIAQQAANLPDGLKRATGLGRLIAAAGGLAAAPEVAAEKLDGSQATAMVKWPWEGTVSFVREGGDWKIAPPVRLFALLKAEAEEALTQARLPVKARLEALWAAAGAGDREALLGCFDGPARAKAVEIDEEIAGAGKQTPKAAELRLVPGLAQSAQKGKVAYGEARLDGDKATLEFTLAGEKDTARLVREAGAWKIALPFAPLDRLKKAADDEVAAAAAGAAAAIAAKQAKEVRSAMLNALDGHAEGKDVLVLLTALAKSKKADELQGIEKALQTACDRLKEPDKVSDPLLAALPGAGAEASCALVRLLGRVGSPKALEGIRTATKNESAEVQDAAVRALAAWPNPRAAGDLLALARSAAKETQHVLALRGYLRLLGLLGDRPADEKVTLFEAALATARRPEEKKAILQAVQALATPGALRLALRYAEDPAVGADAAAAAVAIARSLPPAHKEEAVAALKQAVASAKDPELRRAAEDELAKLGSPAPPKRVVGPAPRPGGKGPLPKPGPVPGRGIRVGDKVRVTAETTPVMLGAKTLATLDEGTELNAIMVLDHWVFVKVTAGDKAVEGWVHENDLDVAK